MVIPTGSHAARDAALVPNTANSQSEPGASTDDDHGETEVEPWNRALYIRRGGLFAPSSRPNGTSFAQAARRILGKNPASPMAIAGAKRYLQAPRGLIANPGGLFVVHFS